jgi:malonyl-CoA O-methyltransferase
VDDQGLRHVLARLHATGDAPWLHGEVARRMAERLPVIRLQPERIVDWSARLGGSAALLAARYPKSQIAAVESDSVADLINASTAGAAAAPWWSRLLPVRLPRAVLGESQVPPGQSQLVWANMGLHAAIDPQAVMRQWQQALAVDGFLMFSTLGPGSLQSLRDLYRRQGWPAPHAPFVDMHDLGDMLIEAGFADPVMDQETLTLTWANGAALLAELRQLGGNVDPKRFAGLRTPRWRQRLIALLQASAGPAADADARPGLEFEVVYGHAFRPPPRHKLAAETALPLADMRAMVRASRGKP